MDHEQIRTNGITLHVATDGPRTGPLLLLLHGFPETSAAWQRQQESLATLGWRVWAPDLRGYGESDKPRGTSAYTTEVLAADIVGLIDAAGVHRAAIVGHDWGGIIAWQVAMRHPERLSSLVVMNAPHPAAMRRRLLRDPRQTVRSWYAFMLQVPRLPEMFMRRKNWQALERALVRTSRPHTFGAPLLERYRIAWSRPGAITAMIDYYRAAFRHPGASGDAGKVATRTLILWGTEDAFILRVLATDSARRCADARVEYVNGATHWLHHEEPVHVTASIDRFLGPATT